MPQTTPDILTAAVKCYHLNSGLLRPEFIVIHSPHAALFAVTTMSSHKLRQASSLNQDWEIAINLPPRALLQLMEITTPGNNDLEPASESTIAAFSSAPPPKNTQEHFDASSPQNL